MKKILCLILVLVLSFSTIAACGKDGTKTQKPENNAATSTSENTEEKSASVDNTVSNEVSTKNETASQNKVTQKIDTKSDSKDDNSSEFYIITNGKDDENRFYHTDDCSLLKNKETQVISWEMIKMIEFRQCTNCKPTKYEGYVE